MKFDRFTVGLFVLREDAPAATRELQDAHLAHLAQLQEEGELLAAGPLDDERLRGLCLLRAETARARELLEQNPAVAARRLAVEVFPWLVPGGVIGFSPSALPRSLAEAED